LIAFFDTNALVLLGEGRAERFGAQARRLVVSADRRVSPIVLLELHFLSETGRLKGDPNRFYAEVLDECDIVESQDPVVAVAREAASFTWTRDPFDRLIVATAMLHHAKLITKDGVIRDHFDGAVW
jgi:PIN domain nuclease of toxin-antitoxin system